MAINLSDSFHIDELSLSPEYAYTKANLAYFLPELFPHSEELYRELKKQQEQFKDQFDLSALDIPYEIRGTENFSEQLKKGPVIFVSYHMGPPSRFSNSPTATLIFPEAIIFLDKESDAS